jgi:hypothetical protein
VSKKTKSRKNIVIAAVKALTPLSTQSIFDKHHKRHTYSPLDQFFDQTKKLHILVDPSKFNSDLANLIVLGYISAVESYLRAISRQIIILDEESMKLASQKDVLFGSAIHSEISMLPEILFEKTSMASKHMIITITKEYFGIKGHLPNDLNTILDEFDHICQIRHCIIHRFSMLSSHAAMKLGIKLHKDLIEKPLMLDYRNLQEIFSILDLTVRSYHNFLFTSIIERFAKEKFTWDYRKDKAIFKKYFKIFTSTTMSVKEIDIYNDLRHNAMTK